MLLLLLLAPVVDLLQEERGKFFSQLDSEASHAMFGEFVERWNAGRLPGKYYR